MVGDTFVVHTLPAKDKQKCMKKQRKDEEKQKQKIKEQSAAHGNPVEVAKWQPQLVDEGLREGVASPGTWTGVGSRERESPCL